MHKLNTVSFLKRLLRELRSTHDRAIVFHDHRSRVDIEAHEQIVQRRLRRDQSQLSAEGEFLEEDSQDDLPASIPMNFQRQEETEFVETFEATEQLLERIEKLDSTSGPSQEDVPQEETARVAPAAPAAPAAPTA